jgi:hypothetical protein
MAILTGEAEKQQAQAFQRESIKRLRGLKSTSKS